MTRLDSHRADVRTVIRSRERAFTLIEVMLSLVLATLVLGGTLSLFGLLFARDRFQGETFKTTEELALAQEVLRRSMNMLVAGPPLEESELVDDEPELPADEDAELLEGEEEAEEEDVESIIRSALGDSPLVDHLLDEARQPEIQFELYYDDVPGVGLLPMLTMVTSYSPVPRTRDVRDEQAAAGEESLADATPEGRARRLAGGTVRGRYELGWYEDGLALQWVWLDEPYLEPYILVRRVNWLEWRVLVTHEVEKVKVWDEIWAAYLKSDFPYAVRLTLSTTDGLYVDWVFETSVLTPDTEE